MTKEEFSVKAKHNLQYRRIQWLIADFTHEENLHYILKGSYFLEGENTANTFNNYFLRKKNEF
jgi:hypothetical protein